MVSLTIGIVDDSAVFVFGDGLSLHYPFQGGFAVNHVFIGFQGDMRQVMAWL